MADRGVIMSDHSVRAILAGEKDVTRRIGPTWARVKPGTRLWVREAHIFVDLDEWDGPRVECTNLDQWPYPWNPHAGLRDVGVYYRADQGRWRPCFVGDESEEVRWRPSIHMPRWACRLELEVVSVTEERLVIGGGLGQMAVLLPKVDDDDARREGFADRRAFLDAWRSMHPDYDGPVYRIEFRRAA